MNYDGLQASYWNQQIERIESLRKKINERSQVVPGRVIPDDESLVVGSGRRMNLAILFLDISGFSGRASYTPEEQAANLRILNLFFSEMVKIAEDYGGVVEKNTGDGLLAYFEDLSSPLPVTATRRAVASSLTMFAANAVLINPILRNSSLPEISFRMSIDYGPVTLGLLGAPRRFNSIVAVGTPANFASKMLVHAKPGELVLGDQARLQLPLLSQVLSTELALANTGWTYTLTGLPYPLFRYTHRWTSLI
jgi:adenylate cyclase